MTRKSPPDVRRIASIGAGPIGGGWSAYYLARGYQVTTYLHDPQEEEKLRRVIDTAWQSLERLGVVEGASPNSLSCTTDLEEAVANADFVQESVPEDLALKQKVYASLGKLVPTDIVIASSTSGLSMSDIQAQCPSPERTVAAHPFNPPYLMPLVEIVGGEKTDPQTVNWTAEFFRQTGKAPLVLNKEVPGYVASRLQEALWREALHMVANGEATVEQIDMAVVNGLGPRWAFMGPCMTFHVGGGEGGMAYSLEQFGPSLKAPKTRLIAPELTSALRERMVEGCDRLAGGRHFTELSQEMNDGLIAVLKR